MRKNGFKRLGVTENHCFKIVLQRSRPTLEIEIVTIICNSNGGSNVQDITVL
jgi:hypothetical protein